jgi:hypothetical protein
MLESKKSQQDLFVDNSNVPKSRPEMSKVESELLGYSNLYGNARILYPTAEQERLMNLHAGADYH